MKKRAAIVAAALAATTPANAQTSSEQGFEQSVYKVSSQIIDGARNFVSDRMDMNTQCHDTRRMMSWMGEQDTASRMWSAYEQNWSQINPNQQTILVNFVRDLELVNRAAQNNNDTNVRHINHQNVHQFARPLMQNFGGARGSNALFTMPNDYAFFPCHGEAQENIIRIWLEQDTLTDMIDMLEQLANQNDPDDNVMSVLAEFADLRQRADAYRSSVNDRSAQENRGRLFDAWRDLQDRQNCRVNGMDCNGRNP